MERVEPRLAADDGVVAQDLGELRVQRASRILVVPVRDDQRHVEDLRDLRQGDCAVDVLFERVGPVHLGEADRVSIRTIALFSEESGVRAIVFPLLLSDLQVLVV